MDSNLVKVLIWIVCILFMEGIQKLKCTSCGTTFMSETGVAKCPSCSENETHGGSQMGGCGCGHSH